MKLNRFPNDAVRKAFGRCVFSALAGASLLLNQAPALAGDPATGGKDITRVDSRVALDNFQPVTVFAAKGHPIPGAASHSVFGGESGLQVGIWEGEPGVLHLANYPFDEYCLIVSGELVITNAAGQQQVFRAGDSFVIPKGFSGVWEMKTRVRKQSVLTGASKGAAAR